MARAVASTLRFQQIWSPAVPRFTLRMHIVAATFFIVVLVARVHLRQTITNYGYEIADAQEETVRLTMEKQELDLINSIEVRSDNLFAKAKKIGLMSPKSDQVWSFTRE